MALFKISRGLKEKLPITKTSGHCWYTIDDSMFYIDYEDENGEVQRQALNAQDAQTLTGASLATILNSSDIEIPTSKTVLDALSTKVSFAGVQTLTDEQKKQARENIGVEEALAELEETTIKKTNDWRYVTNGMNESYIAIDDSCNVTDIDSLLAIEDVSGYFPNVPAMAILADLANVIATSANLNIAKTHFSFYLKDIIDAVLTSDVRADKNNGTFAILYSYDGITEAHQFTCGKYSDTIYSLSITSTALNTNGEFQYNSSTNTASNTSYKFNFADTSLTMAGLAAESKTVGTKLDALEQKIPSIEGLATESYVDDAIANIDIPEVNDYLYYKQPPIYRIDNTTYAPYGIAIYINLRELANNGKYCFNTELQLKPLITEETMICQVNYICLCDDGSERLVASNSGDATYNFDIPFILDNHIAMNSTNPIVMTVEDSYKTQYVLSGKVDTAANLTLTTNYNSRYLNTTGAYEFIPTKAYHPATKKYVDDSVASIPEQVQANWNQTDETAVDFIKNKPSEADALELAIEMNLVSPVAAEDGSVYTDENGAMYSL